MADSFVDRSAPAHVTKLDVVQFRQAKAEANGINQRDEWRVLVGAAIVRALALAGLTQKEVAALTDRDHATVSRWLTGAERPQFDVLLAVERLRPSLVQALAELAGTTVGIEIETVVRITRRAER